MFQKSECEHGYVSNRPYCLHAILCVGTTGSTSGDAHCRRWHISARILTVISQLSETQHFSVPAPQNLSKAPLNTAHNGPAVLVSHCYANNGIRFRYAIVSTARTPHANTANRKHSGMCCREDWNSLRPSSGRNTKRTLRALLEHPEDGGCSLVRN